MFMKFPILFYWHLGCRKVVYVSAWFLVLENLPQSFQQSNQRIPYYFDKWWIPTTQNSVCHGHFNKCLLDEWINGWMEATIFWLSIILCKLLISVTKYMFINIIPIVPMRKSRLHRGFSKVIEIGLKCKPISFFNLTQRRGGSIVYRMGTLYFVLYLKTSNYTLLQ